METWMDEPGRGQDSLSGRLDFIGLDRNARSALKRLAPVIHAAMGSALASFYEKAKGDPAAGRAFADERYAAVRALQERHWTKIAAAEFGESYAATMREIGQANGRIGLEPRWVIGGYALVLEGIIAAIVKDQWPTFLQISRARPDEVALTLSSLVKAALLDIDLGMSVYLETLDELRHRAEEAGRDALLTERTLVAQSLGVGLAKLAGKDLTYRLSGDPPEAYCELHTDFNAAIEQLDEAMQSVNGAVETIESGAREIGAASEDLAERTERQAANLEETAAALDQITAAVKKSAEGATHARSVVAAADEDAKKSAQVVRQAVESMNAIAKSAQQINQIIGVIDEIAFQTNLLALNAGVEAARAGAAGKGFAVVASEVRALAQRSAEAAKDIKRLISASSAQVENGVKLVAETGAALERIAGQVAEMSGVVADIAAGAKEQATGLQHVNTAINRMDQATQQNAAMVEQSTAASRALSEETARLAGMVSEFAIGAASDERSRPSAGPSVAATPTKSAAAVRTLKPNLRKAAGGSR
jgi:methyl-accepting chemotaxis protein